MKEILVRIKLLLIIYEHDTGLQIYSWMLTCAVIQSLVALVHEPEPEHPLRGDLAEEYTKDKKKFMKNAEDHTKKNAEKRPLD